MEEREIITPDAGLKKIWYVVHSILFGILCLGTIPLFLLFAWWIGACSLVFIVGWMIFGYFVLGLVYKSIEYTIGDNAVEIRRGVFWRKRVTVPYEKITNVDTTQGPFERYFKIGTVHIQTAGSSGTESKAEAVFQGVKDFDRIRKAIRSKITSIRGVSAPREKDAVREIDILKEILQELKLLRERS